MQLCDSLLLGLLARDNLGHRHWVTVKVDEKVSRRAGLFAFGIEKPKTDEPRDGRISYAAAVAGRPIRLSIKPLGNSSKARIALGYIEPKLALPTKALDGFVSGMRKKFYMSALCPPPRALEKSRSTRGLRAYLAGMLVCAGLPLIHPQDQAAEQSVACADAPAAWSSFLNDTGSQVTRCFARV